VSAIKWVTIDLVLIKQRHGETNLETEVVKDVAMYDTFSNGRN
jgi:hypothetical protein